MAVESNIPRYGVLRQTSSETLIETAAEMLAHQGYAILDAGFSAGKIKLLQDKFDTLKTRQTNEYGDDFLRSIDEQNTIRCPLAYDEYFLDLAMNKNIMDLCDALMKTGIILNQQNGIINPGSGLKYNQSLYHRDLPYQHFVSSRPLAINALYCIDDFTETNGSTLVIPASHKQEDFPSDKYIELQQKMITAPAGSFLVLDCMTYHCGSQNRSGQDRRAVNHLYTIGMIRQQIDLPAFLGEEFSSSPTVRKLLGYGSSALPSPADYFAQRREKMKPS